MTKLPDDPRELARSVTKDVFEVLVDILNHPEATTANRLSAAQTLWDRGWGKPFSDNNEKDHDRPLAELSAGEILERATATLAEMRVVLDEAGKIFDLPALGDSGEDPGEQEPADVRECD